MIVLDTHIWVWWVSGAQKLTKRVASTIDAAAAAGELRVSSISVWEVALLVQKGRLQLTLDVEEWIAAAEALPQVRFVPVDNRIALRSTRLPGSLHNDPADRIIIATCISLGGSLITKDEKLRRYPHVETIW